MAIEKVTHIDGPTPIRNILMSVSDKSGLEELATRLTALGGSVRIYSTGGTYERISAVLGSASPQLVRIADYTGQPEMRGGLVKTLDFKIYAGILSESYNDAHIEDLERLHAVRFDLVVVNLYPFKATIERREVDIEDARGNIDIGGPCMLRAAAKNFLRVTALCDPADYPIFLKEVEESGGTISLSSRFRFAVTAFGHTASYDTAIAHYLANFDPAAVSSPYAVENSPK